MCSIVQVRSSSARQNQIERTETDVTTVTQETSLIGIGAVDPTCSHIFCDPTDRESFISLFWSPSLTLASGNLPVDPSW